MNNYCTKPCPECPFRKESLNGWLGGYSPEATALYAVQEEDFHCHLTRGTKNPKHCAGRMLFAKRNCKIFRRPDLEKIKNAVLALNPDYKETILDIGEFVLHHTIKKKKQ